MVEPILVTIPPNSDSSVAKVNRTFLPVSFPSFSSKEILVASGTGRADVT